MESLAAHLDWLDSQANRLRERVVEWCGINSASGNLGGLAAMAARLKVALSELGGTVSEIVLPSWTRVGLDGRVVPAAVGVGLSAQRRPSAPLRVLLAIHYDTVYPADGPFQQVHDLGGGRLNGPGVADAKGGIVVMLAALALLERTPFAERMGWEVFLNPDEEIGSPSSAGFFREAARRNHFGLLFEPALDERGTLAGARGGSGNFTVVVRGRAAHAGRDFANGRNAVVAAAKLAQDIHSLNGGEPGVVVNVGALHGGDAVNVVPDLAVLRVNVRVARPEQAAPIERQLEERVAATSSRDGIHAEMHGHFHNPPKPLTCAALRLFDHVATCGRELGLDIAWRDTGGVCDGNKLAAAGLPNVDSLGVRGGQIHSPDEYLVVESLVERAKLTALLLMRLARGDLAWV